MNTRVARCAAVLGVSSALMGCMADATNQSESEQTLQITQLLKGGHRQAGTFYVPPPNPDGVRHALSLVKDREFHEALLIAKMLTTPQAVWFTEGTPREVKRAVKKTTKAASRQKRVPVLVAYNLPFRDCAQYSAGGAIDTEAYAEWIDGFAEGIGEREAVVILEPDGLGIIPYNTTFWNATEWCRPIVVDDEGNTVPAPGASASERYAQLRHALASLKEKAPNARVYLDATHSHWLGVGEAAYRLYLAGFDDPNIRPQGFFINASNYQQTAHAEQFGEWVSMCLTTGITDPVNPGYQREDGVPQFGWCPGQYREDEPGSGNYIVDFSEQYVADTTAGLEGLMSWTAPGASASTTFVIDTSRNGQGPLDVAPYGETPYNQPESVLAALNAGNWCNPPGRGLGLRPTADTENALLDAYLWIKIPGESDGTCDTAGGARAWDFSLYNPWGVPEAEQATFDPLWGMVNPPAGAWFREQALELVQNANPPLF